VLGAGLAGMSAALELGELGVSHRLFERKGHVGGLATTRVEEGYRFDQTGHLLHLRDETMRDRVLGWLGDDHLQVERKSRIWSHGTYTRYPFQANTHGLPKQVVYECLTGFIKAHFEHSPEPANFEQFCRAHFGEGISKHFMLPYNEKLWGVPASAITSEWCRRFVPLPKLEDVVKGALGYGGRELGYNTRFVFPRLGVGELSRAMQHELPDVELENSPVGIDHANRALRFADETVHYDHLVSTVPLSTLVDLLEQAPPEVIRARQALRCNHLYYLDVALDVPSGLDYHWAYVPEPRYPFYRVGCYSNFSSAMAPQGRANLYVELSSRDQPELDQIVPRVVEGLTEMGWIRAARDVRFARLRRIDHAYVLFDHEYSRALARIEPFLEQHGIISTGRYGAWTYCSMEDALIAGRSAARKLGGASS
jgi:protoporphyrinogen oxidase